ncbi:MAG: PTS sugar transporter subunit IIBC, partial [Streptococcus sp.]|nr:PTS sugar transporter subunit IIBC [Streptococcus sp.]
KQAKVAVAICKEEVEWDNVSNRVQIIFMISPSVYGNEELKLVTEKIITLTEKNEIQRELLHCEDFVTFITLLESL